MRKSFSQVGKNGLTARIICRFSVFGKIFKKSVKPIDKVGEVCYNHINLVNR